MLSDHDSDINPDDSPIQMTVEVDNSEIKYDLTTDADWACTSGSCTRSWTPDKFDGEGEMTFSSNRKRCALFYNLNKQSAHLFLLLLLPIFAYV